MNERTTKLHHKKEHALHKDPKLDTLGTVPNEEIVNGILATSAASQTMQLMLHTSVPHNDSKCEGGTGKGANKWVLHLIGGGYCTATEDCYIPAFPGSWLFCMGAKSSFEQQHHKP